MSYYGGYGNTQYQMYQQSQHNNGLIWVQGIEAMKSYPVMPGQSVLLMDSETNCFGIKTVDTSGMPLPLRIFDYTERAAKTQPAVQSTAQASQPAIDTSLFVTREEFEAKIAELSIDRKDIQKGETVDVK